MKASAVPGLRIVILAAGFSRRLGRPKALTRIHGIGLLRRTASVLRPLSGKSLIVVTPPRTPRLRQELAGLGVQLVANPDRSGGQSTSLRVGINAARWSAATLVVAADLAALERADVVRLVQRWRALPRRLAARRIGANGGTPVILPKRHYRGVQRISGDVGLRTLLAEVPADERVLVGMRSAAQDIDTPSDLQRARRRFPRR